MSRGDNYPQLMKLWMVLVSMIEPARLVEEKGQRVVRLTDWSLWWECCPGDERPVCFNWKLPGRVWGHQITAYICYSMYIELLFYLFYLAPQPEKTTSELRVWFNFWSTVLSSMFDVWHAFPCSHCVLKVTVTSAGSWNAETLAAQGYCSYCTLWFMALNLTDLFVESAPWALFHIAVYEIALWTGMDSWLFNLKYQTTFAVYTAISVTDLKHSPAVWR